MTKPITHKPTGDELRVLRRTVRGELLNAQASARAAARPIAARSVFDDSPLNRALARLVKAADEAVAAQEEVLP